MKTVILILLILGILWASIDFWIEVIVGPLFLLVTISLIGFLRAVVWVLKLFRRDK